MKSRYPARVLLTSLALIATIIGATPRPSPQPLDCLSVHRLYSERLFRRARAMMLLELAKQHERRASVLLGMTERSSPVPQETPGPRLKHLLTVLATSC